MKTLFKVILATALLTACTDEAGSRKALESHGFTNIELTGFDLWSCSKDDDFATKFRATNSAGKRVQGVVCCGWMKNCTVRF